MSGLKQSRRLLLLGWRCAQRGVRIDWSDPTRRNGCR
jgi:hypothetical protein